MTQALTDLKSQIATAVDACHSKKAEELAILEMDKQAFTDYLIICHGSNPRQVQAIADEVQLRIKTEFRSLPNNTEGYQQAQWVLMDYVDFVVHIFTAEQRRFRDLERLWKSATRVSLNEIRTRPMRPRKAPGAETPVKRRGARPKVAATAKTRKAMREATSRRAPAKKTAKKSAKKAAKKTPRRRGKR